MEAGKERHDSHRLVGPLSLKLVSEVSEKDVINLQPAQPEVLRNMHRTRRLMAVLKRYVADLEAHIRSAGGQVIPASGLPKDAAEANAAISGWSQTISLTQLGKAMRSAVPPPNKEKTERVIVAIKNLTCMLVMLPCSERIDVLKIDDVPKKRVQSLLRSQLCIEYLVKLVQLCWVGFFNKNADQIKASRDDRGNWCGSFMQDSLLSCPLSFEAILQIPFPAILSTNAYLGCR